jgi:two-component system nitrogen regulation response regulator GlnG
MEDLPLEFRQGPAQVVSGDDHEEWPVLLRQWADQFLASGQEGLHTTAEPMFERVLIESALQASQFHRQNAAKLLGWGRNTLTRKSQALGLE